MSSYKIHSIKNNKKLSFIIDGEDINSVKESLSRDGFIVINIDKLDEEKRQIPRFVFEALKENKSRMEGRVDALDVFSAYQILRDDYQYTILKLYPIDVVDPIEQDMILKNILEIFPENTKNTKNKEEVKSKTFTEVDVLKKYLGTLESYIEKANIENKDILLYDINRVQMMNSISGSEEVIKKIIKIIYNKAGIEEKKSVYKIINTIAKHVRMFIFPPFVFQIIIGIQNMNVMMKVLFSSGGKKHQKKESKIKPILYKKFLQNNDLPEKKIYSNKNIFLLMKKKYRSSWLDMFKSEGSYLYFYSLLRQNRSLFWLKKLQEYIGIVSMYASFIFVLGIIIVGIIMGPLFLFFNGFILAIMSIISLALVFFFKEI